MGEACGAVDCAEPPATGACCTPMGLCIPDLAATSCTEIGGSHLQGEKCSESLCLE